MEQHNSCVNTKAIIDYMASRQSPIQELLVGLEEDLTGIKDPVAFLTDPHNWVSADVCRAMYANARRLTGNPLVAYHIGFESVLNKRLGYIQEILVRAIGSPRGAVRRVKAINDKFNRTKTVELVKESHSAAIIRLHWDQALKLNKDFCLMNQGVYSAMFTVWGLPPGKVVETRCQFDGHQFCEFELNWVNPSWMGRLKLLFYNRRKLLAETLSEIEHDKQLLSSKFQEVQNLNYQLQQKVDQLWSIHQASSAILSELDFGKLLPEVLRIFIKEISYSRGLLMLIDQKRQTLKYVEGVGLGQEDMEKLVGYEISLSKKHNILVQVVLTGQPVISQDVSTLNLNWNNVILRTFQPQSIVLLPLLARGRLIGVLAAERSKEGKKSQMLDREYLQGFTNQVALAIENASMYKELRDSYLKSVQALVVALEAKDPYTKGHSERVTWYSVGLAQRIGMAATQVDQVRKMCLVHDIGKIGIDDVILNKNGHLVDLELEHIRRHPLIGHKIIEPLNLEPEEVAIVRHHHERFDGQGYPDGLAGEQIPVQVRIASLCDAFDAMTSDRPYRRALTLGEALFRLRAASGTQFDPDLVTEFDEMIRSGHFHDLLHHLRPAQVA